MNLLPAVMCARGTGPLGHEPVALPVGPGRAPVWPAGIIGSISHTDDIAIAAVARQSELRSLGIDLESADPLEPGLLELVCREDERAALAVSGLEPELGAKLIFSAKESVYKCLWPLTGIFLEFHAIGIRIDPLGHRFTAYGEDPRIEEALANDLRWIPDVLAACCSVARGWESTDQGETDNQEGRFRLVPCRAASTGARTGEEILTEECSSSGLPEARRRSAPLRRSGPA